MSKVTRRSFLLDVLAGGATLWLGAAGGLSAILSACARQTRSRKATESRPSSERRTEARTQEQGAAAAMRGEETAQPSVRPAGPDQKTTAKARPRPPQDAGAPVRSSEQLPGRTFGRNLVGKYGGPTRRPTPKKYGGPVHRRRPMVKYVGPTRAEELVLERALRDVARVGKIRELPTGKPK